MPIVLDAGGGGGITLAQLEQEVARRTGPFFQAAQDTQTPTTSTTTAAYMPTLKTTALLGGPENLWLLRRGVRADGSAVTYNDQDRTRMVLSFDSAAGRVIVDRNWYAPMQPGELADFTHLHPDQELRPAVLAGLRRCFTEDRGRVYPNLSGSQVDLTTVLPWIVSPDQLLRVQSGYAWTTGDMPFEAVSQAGHVILASGAAPSGVWITVLRPAWSWVNGAESTTGPTRDTDVLAVDLDYAASAGHIESWHLWPSHMFAAAAGNLQATQEMAAREFTRQSLIWGPKVDRNVAFNEVVRLPL
jgi:hypothetical protein